jgi:peptidoglycan/LPS O-acetylase OafA/YrhL
VEWEFYLLWPLVLVLALRRGWSPERLAGPVLAVAAGLFVVRGVLFAHGGDWILSYHSAWLRFDELLLGAVIGLAGHRFAIPGWVRTAGLLALLVIISRADYPDGWLYQGGMALVACAAAVLVQPRTTPWAGDRLLGSAPLVWVGRLSYSLYLWSVPVIAEVGHRGADWPRVAVAVVAVTLSFACAAASYWLVEARFRAPSRSAAVTGSPRRPSLEAPS